MSTVLLLNVITATGESSPGTVLAEQVKLYDQSEPLTRPVVEREIEFPCLPQEGTEIILGDPKDMPWNVQHLALVRYDMGESRWYAWAVENPDDVPVSIRQAMLDPEETRGDDEFLADLYREHGWSTTPGGTYVRQGYADQKTGALRDANPFAQDAEAGDSTRYDAWTHGWDLANAEA